MRPKPPISLLLCCRERRTLSDALFGAMKDAGTGCDPGLSVSRSKRPGVPLLRSVLLPGVSLSRAVLHLSESEVLPRPVWRVTGRGNSVTVTYGVCEKEFQSLLVTRLCTFQWCSGSGGQGVLKYGTWYTVGGYSECVQFWGMSKAAAKGWGGAGVRWISEVGG